jgi:hypothetical protein
LVVFVARLWQVICSQVKPREHQVCVEIGLAIEGRLGFFAGGLGVSGALANLSQSCVSLGAVIVCRKRSLVAAFGLKQEPAGKPLRRRRA